MAYEKYYKNNHSGGNSVEIATPFVKVMRNVYAWMVEMQTVGMQSQPAHGITSVSVLHVAGYRKTQISHMNTYLVLPACLQLEFHKRVLLVDLQASVVCDGLLSAIISRTTEGYKCLVVLEP